MPDFEPFADPNILDFPDPQAEYVRTRHALARILEADDEGDGHEMIHALRDARALLRGEPNT